MTVVWESIQSFFPKIIVPGLALTIPLTLISFTFAMVIAILVAFAQYARIPVVRQLCRAYIWMMRGTPVLVQLFVFFYGLRSVGVKISEFTAAVTVFSLNEGAYCAEIVRAALEAVPVGQFEAGRCCGMSYMQIMRRIVLPQAMRTAFPSLSNSLISMVKDTSLASQIGVVEMFSMTKKLQGSTFQILTLYLLLAAIYLVFCSVITVAQHALERYFNRRVGLVEEKKHA